MKILQIVLTDGTQIVLGAPITEDGLPVSSIVYHRNGYNNGHQGQFPAYVLKFDDSPNRQIINQTVVSTIVVDPEKKKKEDTVPDLPAAPGGAVNEQ